MSEPERIRDITDATTWMANEANSGPGGPLSHDAGRTVYLRTSIEGRESYTVTRGPDQVRVQYLLNGEPVIGAVTKSAPGIDEWLAPQVATWLADGYERQ